MDLFLQRHADKTDIVFRRQSDLTHLNAELSETAIHGIKPDKVATFLARNRFAGW